MCEAKQASYNQREDEGFTLPFAATFGFVIVLAIMAAAIVAAQRLIERKAQVTRVAVGPALAETR